MAQMASDVRLLYFENCPNWRIAEIRLKEALISVGADPDAVTFEQVTTLEQAEALGFRGSPTILVNGTDPFAEPSADRVDMSDLSDGHGCVAGPDRRAAPGGSHPVNGDKAAGAIAGVAVVLAVCCGLNAWLILVGRITLSGLNLRSSTWAFVGLIAPTLAVVRLRHHLLGTGPAPRPNGE